MIITNRHAFVESVRKGSSSVVGSIVDLHFPDGNGLFSVEARDLAQLLRRTRGGLEVLKLRHVDLQGDLLPLLQVLSQQKRLRSFQAEFCNFSYRRRRIIVTLAAPMGGDLLQLLSLQ